MTKHTDATSGPPPAEDRPPAPPSPRMTLDEIAKVYTLLPPWLRFQGATREQAEDIVQQVLISTVTRAAEPPGLINAVGYAFRVGRNLLGGLWRATGRETPIQDTADRPGLWSEPYAELDLPLERSQLLAETLKVCQEYLTGRQHDAFHLVYAVGLTHEEAAEVLRIDPGTVRSHLHRGARRLAAHRPELWERLGL